MTTPAPRSAPLRLYYSAGSCSLASHLVLEELGADYEAVKLDMRAGQQRMPEYLAINAKGRVPALVTAQGVLTETPAILLFLAQTYPQADLAPLDQPFELAQLQAVNSYLCSTVHVNHAHKLRGHRWSDDEAAQRSMQAKVAANMAECFGYIEASLLRGPWVMGAHYSVADPYLFTMASWLAGDGVDIEGFPAVAAHSRRLRERPAVQRVLPLHGL
jgi:glutathione S-transferase